MFPIRRLTSGLYVPQHAALRGGVSSVPISLIGVAKNSFITSLSLTLPGTPAENDIVIACCGSDTHLGGLAIDTSGYNNVASLQGNGANGLFVVKYKRLTSSPDSAVAFSNSSARFDTALVALYRNVDTVTALDFSTTTATGTGSEPNAPAGTTATNNAVRVILGFLNAIKGTLGAPTGFGNFSQQQGADSAPFANTIAFADKTEAAAGELDPAVFTGSDSGDWAAVHLALRPAVP